MKKFKKIAACAAALVCAAAMTVSASAKLTTVEQSGYVRSSDGSFLVMLYSDGTYDASEKAVTDYGIDLNKIATVEVTIKTPEDSVGDFGGALIMSSKSKDDPSTHNWPSKDYWGCNDPDLGLEAAAKALKFDKVGDHTYKTVLTLSGNNEVIKNYNFVQFAIQDWGSEIITVQSIVMKDASGAELISFDSKGKASLPLVEEGAADAQVEETKAEEEKPAETTAKTEKEETKKTKKTKEEEKAPETDKEVSEEDTTAADEEEWVSSFDPSTVEFDKDQAPYFDGLQFALRADNDAQNSIEKDYGFGFDITEVYGIKVYVEVDPEDVEHGAWYGGSVGANCPSRGWYQHNFANGDGDELTYDESKGYIVFQQDEPIFSSDDAYAFAFFQQWGTPMGVKKFELLDKNGNVIDYVTAGTLTGPTGLVSEDEVIEEAPAASVDAAADKGNPATGVEDVAVAAGIAALAAGAVVLSRKRK